MAELATVAPPPQASEAPQAPRARDELARGLTDVLSLPDGKQTANERAFAAEILGAALRSAPLDERRAVAERLARVGGAPQVLLRQLLTDDAGVAVPLLSGLTSIPDPLLIEAAAASQEHRLAIAARDDLSEAVAEAVLAPGEAEAYAAVLPGEVALCVARLDAAVAASRSEASLVPLLVARPDLQISHALTLFWWCDGPTRRRLLTRFATDRTVVQDRLQPLFARVFTDTAPDPVVKRLLHVIDRRHRPRGRDGEMVTMDVVERTLAAARAQHGPELCEAVGLLAGVDTVCATRVMQDVGGEPFAILAKSVGVSRRAFASLLEAAAATAPADTPAATEAGRERMTACFDIVTPDFARATLRYWDWRPDGAAAIAPAPTPLATAPTPLSAAQTSYLGAL